MTRAFRLALLLATLPHVGDARPKTTIDVAPTVDPGQAEQAKKLEFAHTLVVKGQPQQAIDQYFQPVIDYYEARYKDDKRRVYSARSPVETLFYMLEAAKDKRSAIALDGTWSAALYGKAAALVDLNRPDEARPVLERASQFAPMNAVVLGELGYLYGAAKQFPESLAMFNRALEASEFSPDETKTKEKGRALRGTGYALTELGRLDEAEAAYKKALALDPNDGLSKNELQYIAGKRRKGPAVTS